MASCYLTGQWRFGGVICVILSRDVINSHVIIWVNDKVNMS